MMSRLSDYLRAEQPDRTEPASFYAPGAVSWRQVHKGPLGVLCMSDRKPTKEGAAENLADTPPTDPFDDPYDFEAEGVVLEITLSHTIEEG